MTNVVAPTTLLLTAPGGSGELVVRRWQATVTAGPDEGSSLTRSGGTMVVGSHAHADLQLTDRSVSRYHAEFRLLAEGVLVVDLDSRNGIRVDTVPIASVFIPSGGTVWLGRTAVQFVALDDAVDLDGGGFERFGEFVSGSAAVQRVLEQLHLAARTDATILLEGETGCGKEVLAQAVHQQSHRAAGPFVVVDCGIAGAGMLEDRLFGHLKGAFTGAVDDVLGAFEVAKGGTVFLDEIAELPLELQPRLLRVLEARSVQRLGEVNARSIDVRFIAATNRDLASMVAARTFREDLYYRIAVIRAHIAPLRSRPEDIAMLADAFVKEFTTGQAVLTDDARQLLNSYDWHGNVRELRNVLERATTLSPRGVIGPSELFADLTSEDQKVRFHEAKKRVVSQFECRYVTQILDRHQGDAVAAAKDAGLAPSSFYALMKRARVKPDSY